ncbi:uncharacterized protein LY79DRAFT_344685 [Colletotrichum navitas]|uniref:Uncharacterized protein n=1 Tax=Colletotrichum navitas TaxID=681940 RepID=A0AAD8PRH9_9PEZI|nr:uncharacterized protein LY79DRAFT_344685 [Colletotrichum navitas]KAK1579391.1 hypothetical protein LY79DRAFT_344685 [Colletotrichum navitas]
MPSTEQRRSGPPQILHLESVESPRSEIVAQTPRPYTGDVCVCLPHMFVHSKYHPCIHPSQLVAHSRYPFDRRRPLHTHTHTPPSVRPSVRPPLSLSNRLTLHILRTRSPPRQHAEAYACSLLISRSSFTSLPASSAPRFRPQLRFWSTAIVQVSMLPTPNDRFRPGILPANVGPDKPCAMGGGGGGHSHLRARITGR